MYVGFGLKQPNSKPMQLPNRKYKNQIDTIRIKQKKLKIKYDTIEIHLRDSLYSTDFLQRAINLHRFIDTQSGEYLPN